MRRQRRAASRHRQLAWVSGVPLNFNFDTGDLSQFTGHDWSLEDGTAPNPPGHQQSLSSTVTRTGSGWSSRMEVHNDAGDVNTGFRSIYGIYDTNDGTDGGTDLYWGVSLLIPVEGSCTKIPAYLSTWELHQRLNLNQANMGGLHIAPHAILFRDGGIQYRMMTGAGVWDGTQWTGYSNYQDLIPLRAPASTTTNTWYDAIVHLRTAEDDNGLIEVWLRSAAEAWPGTPTWSMYNTPTLPFVPGGLDPSYPTRLSTYDASQGHTGVYMECGMYTGSSTWDETDQQMIVYVDNLGRYGSLTAAKAGFPA